MIDHPPVNPFSISFTPFAVDVLACPKCHGRMRLLAMVEDPANIPRFLAAVGEATEVPRRSPGRGPPDWKSRVLRRQALGEEDELRPLGAGDRVAAGSRTRDGPRGAGACASSRIEATRHPPVKGKRASPGPAGVGKPPGWAAPRRLLLKISEMSARF